MLEKEKCFMFLAINTKNAIPKSVYVNDLAKSL